MTGRRRYGAIRKLPSGRWQARLRGPDGGLVTAPETFRTKADASRYLAEIEVEQSRGTWVDHRLGTMPIREWADRYMNSIVHLKPKTKASYESLVRTTIGPHLGDTALRDLAPMDVREWVATLVRQGLSPSRVRQSYLLLSQLMRAAEHDRLIVRSPCVGVNLPRLVQHEPRILDRAQVNQIIGACRPPHDVLVTVLAFTGVRIGEALALRRSSVDGGRLTVRESLSEVSGHITFETPKNHQQRTIVMPPGLARTMADHLARRVPPNPDALVFPGTTGRPQHYNAWRRAVWDPAVATAGLTGVTPHDLRATHASWVIDAGGSVLDAAARLGHSAATVTTCHYARTVSGRDEDIARRLERAPQPAHQPGMQVVRDLRR